MSLHLKAQTSDEPIELQFVEDDVIEQKEAPIRKKKKEEGKQQQKSKEEEAVGRSEEAEKQCGKEEKKDQAGCSSGGFDAIGAENQSGHVPAISPLSGDCVKYEILRKNYIALRHDYQHLKSRYEEKEFTMPERITKRRPAARNLSPLTMPLRNNVAEGSAKKKGRK